MTRLHQNGAARSSHETGNCLPANKPADDTASMSSGRNQVGAHFIREGEKSGCHSSIQDSVNDTDFACFIEPATYASELSDHFRLVRREPLFGNGL